MDLKSCVAAIGQKHESWEIKSGPIRIRHQASELGGVRYKVRIAIANGSHSYWATSRVHVIWWLARVANQCDALSRRDWERVSVYDPMLV